MFTQQYLREHAERRVRAAHAGRAAEPGRTAVTVVLRRFEPTTFARSAVAYALNLPDTLSEPWLRSYTRTVFLSGNPDNLRTRFAFHHVSADGAMAWTLPEDSGETPPLRRLLRLFPAAALPPLPARIEIPPRARAGADLRTARLDVVTTRVSLADYLVHVHHALTEAVLSGVIGAGTGVVLRHLPRLDPAEGPYAMLRAVPDRDAADGRLRACAGVARCDVEGEESEGTWVHLE
ncbi:DUF6182 family protein [Streptomyces sp. BB1-1-1]|uniref:DUF6182 family protein n=1 Tax=Streptomyces sp. BB1-1-1 TaxID=3074430 RepID=UPI00287749A6|nr:DUF6182 family protein [Streptomyces sp. BB1-1-1]WND37022.1 DUF6182 family protein [Streptomyces sp. BB1-1-1]